MLFPKTLSKQLAFVILIMASMKAYSFSMKVTDAEFSSWDERCQAYYAGTSVGSSSRHRNKVPSSLINYYRAQTGTTQAGPWHYCGGLIYFQRAQSYFDDPKLRQRELTKAKSAANYTFVRLSPKNNWWPEIALFLAKVSLELGEGHEAIRFYKSVSSEYPKYAPAYIGESLVLWRAGKTEDAIKLLEGAIREHDLDSSEAFYNLGLYYFKQGNFAKAKEYASEAYKKQYPLTGLKDMLSKEGIDISDSYDE